MAKILILGVGKSGTTILFQILKNSLPPDTVCLFEPHTLRPEDPSSPGGSVLAKVLLESPLGYGHYAPKVCALYDKRIFIHRDPRDVLVSWFLYAPFHLSITTGFAKFAQFASALRAKERQPRSISFLDLLKLQARLAGPGIPPLLIVEEHLRNLRFAVRIGRIHGKGLFHVSYEDIVGRRLGALEEYLGVPLATTGQVDPEYRRVARSKTYGDWRNWFLAEDVDFFRPRLAETMEEYSYGDDWTLPANPEVPVENASGFLMRLASDRGQFTAIDYDAESFPPELNLLCDASLDQSAYLIPYVSPKSREVHPSRGAEIRDPRVETLGGRRVNVLIQGDGYVFAYEVVFAESCEGVSCWMIVKDRHGNGAVVEARPCANDAAETIGPGSTRRIRFEFICGVQPGVYFLDAQVTTSADGVARTFAHRIVDALLVIVRQRGAWG